MFDGQLPKILCYSRLCALAIIMPSSWTVFLVLVVMKCIPSRNFRRRRGIIYYGFLESARMIEGLFRSFKRGLSNLAMTAKRVLVAARHSEPWPSWTSLILA
jgi:hypothetical protein